MIIKLVQIYGTTANKKNRFMHKKGHLKKYLLYIPVETKKSTGFQTSIPFFLKSITVNRLLILI